MPSVSGTAMIFWFVLYYYSNSAFLLATTYYYIRVDAIVTEGMRFTPAKV